MPSAQTCPTRTPAPWRNRVTPGRRSDILSAPPMLAWPSKRQKTIDRLWFCTTKYPPLDGRCYGFSMVPGTILLPYTHIGTHTYTLFPSHAQQGNVDTHVHTEWHLHTCICKHFYWVFKSGDTGTSSRICTLASTSRKDAGCRYLSGTFSSPLFF